MKVYLLRKKLTCLVRNKVSMIRLKNSYLFSVIILASFIDYTELVSLRGRRSVDEINCFTSSLYFPIGIFVVPVMVVISWITWSNNKKKRERMRADLFEQNGGNLLRQQLERRRNVELTLYTAEYIKSITDNYDDARNVELRDCKPGKYYRGTILSEDNGDAAEVAVVKIERVPASKIRRFVDQLVFLSQNHNNLVRIRGCCLETKSPLIVYELRRDGINDTLSDSICTTISTCGMRVRAAAGVARGVEYLNSHNFTSVYGNICSANILMDSFYNAKILFAAGSNLLIAPEQGNCVYKDPNFIRTGRLNKKSDVYSFGVVLVELLTGRLVNDRREALELVELARLGRLNERILDEDEMVGEVVREVAVLAESCLKVEPGERPNMRIVEDKLSEILMQKPK